MAVSFVLFSIAVFYIVENIREHLAERIGKDVVDRIEEYVALPIGDFLDTPIGRQLGYLLSLAILYFAEKTREKLEEKIGEYVVAAIRDYPLAPIGRQFGYIGRQFGYLLCYNSNIEDLRNQVEKLKNTRVRVQELAERKDEFTRQEVRTWLTSVDKITEESSNFLNEELQVNKRRFYGPFTYLRYRQSWYVKEMTEVVDELLRDIIRMISHPAPPPPIGSTSNEDAEAFQSRELIFKQVMEALKDEKINMIGIYGMGGVGKTTLVKEVGKRAKDDNLFDEVVFSVVSATPDLARIQGEIADMLGLQIKYESARTRAVMLFERLKEKKRILVILDDIWHSGWLELIGIPSDCKIVLTSRRLDVCNQMGTQKNFLIGILSEQEGWNLFQKTAGSCVCSSDLYDLAVDLAKECAGLPLAIVTIATALKNEKLSAWKNALYDLRKSILSKEVFSTIELSYIHLESEEAKSFFLLCCLFPEDCDIPIQFLMMYGIGLRLFKEVNTVDQARCRAHALADSLKSSCLLQDSEEGECVKMNDVIRDFAISIASKDKHGFLAITGAGCKGLPEKDTLKRYTAISLLSDDIHVPPIELECPKLEILLLGSTSSSLKFSYNLSLRMESLKVLNLFCIHFLSLPPSLQNLKNLRTLCLCGCSFIDISIIGELRKLEILSFLCSDIEELPKEIGMLTLLRLLDLTRCDKLTKIPPDVILGLSRLEALYMDGSFDKWEIERKGEERNNASLAELKPLSRLTNLEIQIPNADHLPKDLLFKNLSRFKISVGNKFEERDQYPYLKILKLELNVSTSLKDGVEGLLKKAEHLHLKNMKGLKSVVYGLDRVLFQDLRHLIVEKCSEVEYILDASKRVLPISFPVLEKLVLDDLPNLKEICHGKLPNGFFSGLQELRLFKLPGLVNVWKDPVQHICFRCLRVVKVEHCFGLKNLFTHHIAKGLSMLVEIRVEDCENMEEIFENENEAATTTMDCIVLPHLRSLVVRNLPNLRNFSSKKVAFPVFEKLVIYGVHKMQKVAPFNLPQRLRNLKELDVENCDLVEEVVEGLVVKEGHVTETLSQLRKLRLWGLPNLKHIMQWDKFPRGTLGFRILSSINIYRCHNLKSLFSPSIASSLVQLQEVEIDSCEMMETIIAGEREGEENCEEIIVFPLLHTLKLRNLLNLINFMIYTGRCALHWPSLKVLQISACPALMMVTSRFSIQQKPMANDEISKETPQEDNLHELIYTFFNEKDSFHALETLQIHDVDNLIEIWHLQPPAKSFSQLKVLNVGGCHKLSNVVPANLMRSLQTLEKLNVEYCDSVEEVVEVEGFDVEEKFDPLSQLKELRLCGLPKLKHIMRWNKFPLGFQILSSIYIYGCPSLKSLFSPSVVNNLVQLQEINIDTCKMMEMIIAEEREGEENCIEILVFPQLHTLKLRNLPKLINFMIYTERCTLNWPSLKVLQISGCPALMSFTSRFSNHQKPVINDEISKEAPQEGNLHDPIHTLFDRKVSSPTLETLQIHDVRNLIEIWHPQLLTKSFSQLKALNVGGCDKVSKIVPFNLIQRLQSLEELNVEYCNSVEEVIELEGLVVEEGHGIETLSQLRKLRLWGLPKLKHILQWDKFPHGTLGFQILSSIHIYGCHNLKSLFSSSIASSLVQLQEVEIDSCEMMETIIVGEREGEENCKEIIVFPLLHTLKLRNLPKLINFMIYTGICTLNWPSLKVSQISAYPASITFTSRSSMLQKHLMNDEISKEAPQEGNLHDPIHTLLKEKVSFPALETLQIQDVGNLEIWYLQLPAKSFSQLKVLNVVGCHRVSKVVPFNLIQWLRSLKKLSVEYCNSVEEVIEVEGLVIEEGHVTETLSQLRKLRLWGLPKLKHIVRWDKFPHGALGFRILSSIHIYGCHGLKSLFSPSMASCLVQLEELKLDSCDMLETIIADEKEGEENYREIIVLQKLRTLKLQNLPKLISFQQKCWINDEAFKEARPGSNPLDPMQPLFDKKVAFTNLEVLQIINIKSLQEIFHNQLPDESFSQLKLLQVTKCHKLSRVVQSKLLPRLENLQALVVEECNSMEEIFEGLVGEKRTAISLYHLEKVELHYLPNLRSFCSGKYNFELPSLITLRLEMCSKLRTISSGIINAPNLETVEIKNYEKVWKGDLNRAIQHLSQGKNWTYRYKPGDYEMKFSAGYGKSQKMKKMKKCNMIKRERKSEEDTRNSDPLDKMDQEKTHQVGLTKGSHATSDNNRYKLPFRKREIPTP